MTSFFFTPRFRRLGLPSLLCGVASALIPNLAYAEVPLTRADIESIYNQVEFIPEGQRARRATLNDRLALGDALRTADNARAELRFNDGSLARVGERATFWFVPDTRDFRLSNGTALFLIPPDRGPSNIQTPSAVTGIQGTALVVRHIPGDCDLDLLEECPGRTIVMVLTDSPKGPVEVSTLDGRTEALTAGNLAVIQGESIQVLEFDLALFYQTSPLVEGLDLNNPNFEGNGQPTDPVRQETWEGLQSQQGFEGSYQLNPDVVSLDATLGVITSWLLPTDDVEGSQLPGAFSRDPIANVNTVTDQMGQSTTQPRASMASPLLSNPLSSASPTRDAVPAGVLRPTGPSGQPPTTAIPQPPISPPVGGGGTPPPTTGNPVNPIGTPPPTTGNPVNPIGTPPPTTPVEPFNPIGTPTAPIGTPNAPAPAPVAPFNPTGEPVPMNNEVPAANPVQPEAAVFNPIGDPVPENSVPAGVITADPEPPAAEGEVQGTTDPTIAQ
ncbi:MAG: FecR domain-containing protein [Leptolyngbyaceae cyanobacterium]